MKIEVAGHKIQLLIDRLRLGLSKTFNGWVIILANGVGQVSVSIEYENKVITRFTIQNFVYIFSRQWQNYMNILLEIIWESLINKNKSYC